MAEVFKFFLFALILSSPGITQENSSEIKPFETDYCTMFIEGNWKHCCLEHDMRYWIGGTKSEQDVSDLRLKSCVEEAGRPFMAKLIYFSVRSGHYSPVKHRYKWSWGFGDDEVFEELNEAQRKAAADEIRRSTLDTDLVEDFIDEHLGEEL